MRKRSARKRNSKVNFGAGLILFSLVAGYGSYLNFYQLEQCSAGGSKLSWLFAWVCVSLGKDALGFLWLLIALAAFFGGVACVTGGRNKSSPPR